MINPLPFSASIRAIVSPTKWRIKNKKQANSTYPAVVGANKPKTKALSVEVPLLWEGRKVVERTEAGLSIVG